MTDPLGLIRNTPSLSPLQPGKVGAAGAPGSPAAQGPSFKDVLMENIEQVNKLQKDAEAAIEDLATGRRDDMSNVLIAKEKADLAFKMLLQVRNKLQEAYDEVKQLRV
jgi:flagellar hook-basal body complex protein FliE